MKKFKLTPLERSWILYDIGNSAFILLAATLLPIFFMATKDIRDKYVLSRLAWDLGILEELAETLK